MYLRLNDFLAAMQALEPPQNKLLAVPTQPAGGLQLFAPEVFVLSRDVVAVLASTELMARLTGRGGLTDALSRWVGALGLEILTLPARLHMVPFECAPVLALHPAPPGASCN